MDRLFSNNQAWVERKNRADPDFFARLARQQSPRYLWIGCSDSRVPANEIVGMDPGEIFMHRNVANLVVSSDLNLLAVLQYAVEILEVRHVIVCGHYGCGGILAAMERQELGLIDNWLVPIKRILMRHRQELEGLDPERRQKLLTRLNVAQQVRNLAATSIVQHAWAQGRELDVHGVVYGLEDGRLRDLGCRLNRLDQLDPELQLR
jgi:carbonic anhydrase